MNEKKESLKVKPLNVDPCSQKPTTPPNTPVNATETELKARGPILITPGQMSLYIKKSDQTFFKVNNEDLHDWDSTMTDEKASMVSVQKLS